MTSSSLLLKTATPLYQISQVTYKRIELHLTHPLDFYFMFHSFYFSFLQVDIPKGTYRGQNPTMLVSKNAIAAIPNTRATVPETVPVKYNIAIIITTIIRSVLSADPIFFFIIIIFK
jgi:hypothetical protein